jgi:hypothetical protein
MDGSRTAKKIVKGKIYGNQTGGKPKERSIVTRDTRLLLGTGGWKRLVLERQSGGKNIEEARA